MTNRSDAPGRHAHSQDSMAVAGTPPVAVGRPGAATDRGGVTSPSAIRRVTSLLDRVSGGRADWIIRFISYAVVGGSAAVVNLICFTLLYYQAPISFGTGATAHALHYVVIFAIAAEISTLTNFIINDRVTFSKLPGHARSWIVRCLRFHLTTLVGTLVTLIVSYAVARAGAHAFVAEASGIAVAFLVNFTLHHLFTYSHVRTTGAPMLSGQNRLDGPDRGMTVANSSGTHDWHWLPESRAEAQARKTRGDLPLKFSIVIPAHNEEEALRPTISRLYQVLFEERIPFEILVVNDHSTDATEAVLQRLSAEYPALRYVNNEKPGGFGRAIQTGLEHFAGDAVCIVMADASDDPRDVVTYYRKLQEGYECVFGSRFVAGSRVVDYPRHKLLVNRLANGFINVLFQLHFNDTTNAFKAYRREVIAGIMPVLAPHFNITVELPLKAITRGYTYATVPINWYNRATGVSKLKIKEMGSRYLFIVLYIWLEKLLTHGDYRRPNLTEADRERARALVWAQYETMPHKIVASPGNASSGKHIDEIDTMKMPVTTAIANGNRRRASSTIPLDETVSDPGLSLPSQTRRRLHFHVLDLAFIGALALGSFLRLFRIDTAPFWNDSAGTFTLAHEVLTLGALPITGIHSSIGSFTPPGAVYVYLLPSLLGSPTLGAIETALANIAAIVLIYYVCRLYLNPVIGFLTALLFSISAGPVTFSRFIWQPNMQVPFTVLLIALVLAGVIGKRRGWLMWALPVLGLAIQMHPVTGALLGLIIIGWLLAPETVRIRDLVIGSILTLALFVPTIVFEVMSKFFDLKVYEALAHKPSVISASVFHRFLQIDELTWVPGWGNTRIYHALNVAWEALLVVGLCYVALRVIAPFLMAARRSLAAGGWRRGIPYILGWMRDDRRARWRIDLIVLLWPSLILAAQIRHNSFVNIHYVIGIFPAQFLATAFFLYDVGAVIPRLRLGVRVPAIGIVAMCSVLLAAVCITQPTGIITSYFGDQPRSLASEQADLAQAQSLAMRYHVSLVVFQTDYQSREPTRYLLQTRYPFAAPTQIMASGACLAGAPAGGDSVLYLMSGNKSLWEAFITQIPGVHDLLSESRPVGFFRAYVVTADELASQLKPFGASVTPASVTFGDTIAADHLWQIPVAGQSASALAVEAHMLNAPSSPEFERLYGLSATISGSEGQAAVSGSTACNVAPWMPQQKVYYMLRQVTTDDITPGATLTLSASDVTYNDGNLRLGSLRLITAYDLSTAEYLTAPVARQTFPVNGCGQAEVTCTDATTAVIKLG